VLPPAAASSPLLFHEPTVTVTVTAAFLPIAAALGPPASQPVLFPRAGQLALPLRAFLATTWTVAVASSPPNPILLSSVSLSFGLSPGPSLFLPFAFPPPACPCPGAQQAKAIMEARWVRS